MSRFAALLAAGFLAACAPAPSPRSLPAGVPAVTLLGPGPLVIPHGCRSGGFHVGGLSGIGRGGGGTYLAVVDNEKQTPARVLRLAFAVGGQGVSPPSRRSVCGVVTGAIPLAGLDGESFDGEGIALLPSGGFLVSSETEPSIREISATGEAVATLPVPAYFLKTEGKGIRNNEGFESLALEAGGALWTANERALQQDAPADVARPSPVRLLRFERRGESFVPGPQYVYEVEAIPNPPAEGFKTRGLSDLLALPEGGLLALEREYVEGRGLSIQLYLVSLEGATDVSSLDSLAEQTWTPVRKTLVFDFTRGGFTPDNLEGMTLGPRLDDGSRTLVLVADDNFDWKQQTQIVALRLPARF